jgi:hypothetical protein
MRNPLFAVALSLASILAGQSPIRATPLPAPSVGLVYALPLASTVSEDLDSILRSLRARLPTGARISAISGVGFTVEVDDAAPARLTQVRHGIEMLGTLELRTVADNAHCRNNDVIDVDGERRRLQAWLDSGGRERLRVDGSALDAFHADPQRGPVAGPRLRWFVHRIEMDKDQAGRWLTRFTDRADLQGFVLAGHEERDWNAGTIPGHIQALPAEQRYLLEFVAVDMTQPCFANRDFATTGLVATPANVPASIRMFHLHTPPGGTATTMTSPTTQDGCTGLTFRIVGQRTGDFADWTELHRGRACVVLWDGEVAAMPRIESRIPGEGVIAGAFEEDRVKGMYAALQTAPLAAKPRLLRREALAK